MTLSKLEIIGVVLVAFVAGVGAVTATGACIACKNAKRITAVEERQQQHADFILNDVKRIAALEAADD